jgi:hypothetical protein
MQEQSIRRHFESMGARVRFRRREADVTWAHRRDFYGLAIDIAHDRGGSYFEIVLGRDAPDLTVMQSRPKERHLLLYARDGNRFLCGHDERDWFVAAVPERVSTVRGAMRALMPDSVRKAAHGVSPVETSRRRNVVFKRQGEWFFVPVDREFPEETIHRNEPIQRSLSSKPHICSELHRDGGQQVYLVGHRMYTKEEYREHARRSEKFARRSKEIRVVNPEVYARGAVRHPDHATLRLDTWHRVHLSREKPVSLQSSVVWFID